MKQPVKAPAATQITQVPQTSIRGMKIRSNIKAGSSRGKVISA
jgi:hypothetical protein